MGISNGYVTVFATAVCVAALAGCRGDDADEQRLQDERIEQARKEERRIAKQEAKLRELQRQLRERKGGDSAPSGQPAAPPPASASAPAATQTCGGGAYVNGNTSCPFAANVRDAYYRTGGGDTNVTAYSPATGRDYVMRCTGGSPHVCVGGSNAVLTFP